MFDLAFPVPSIPHPAAIASSIPNAVFDPVLPFALMLPDRRPAAAMSGQARPLPIGHFATLADAMRGVIIIAEDLEPNAAPIVLAILDRDARLVLAGAAANGAVAGCAPVVTATEARAVVMEASQLRAQASRAADRQESDLAIRLRHRADLLEARLVDPLWRSFTAQALQVAA